jgi:uncharacterized membrane protein YgdD (TMEM256/DUF423 family)
VYRVRVNRAQPARLDLRLAAAGAVNAFLAVAAGAFGAHGLKERIDADLLVVFEVGARYHMVHALGLFAVAWLASRQVRGAALAGTLMLLGIVLFSGSLYALALSGERWLGAITPIGGVALLGAWTVAALAALRAARDNS